MRMRNETSLFSSLISHPSSLVPHVRSNFAQVIECGADYLGAGPQACGLLFVKRKWKCFKDTVSAHKSWQRDGDILDADHVLHWRSHGQDRALVMEDHVHNAGQGAADTVVGGVLSANDRVCRAAYFPINVLADRFGKMDAAEAGEFFQGHSANRRQRPGEDFRIAMFTNHVSMDMVW